MKRLERDRKGINNTFLLSRQEISDDGRRAFIHAPTSCRCGGRRGAPNHQHEAENPHSKILGVGGAPIQYYLVNERVIGASAS
jgi:hypothetical protein